MASKLCLYEASESDMQRYKIIIDEEKTERMLRNTHVMEEDSRYGFLYLGDLIYAFFPSLETALMLPNISPSDGQF